MNPIIHTIDAQAKRLGRVASEAASILMGKDSVTFAKNKVPSVKVTIVNASKAAIDNKKMEQKDYVTYTGFPGGLYNEKLGELVVRKGYGEAFKQAVRGMLPKNKLTDKMMKNLTVTE
jgi:large subunit ribosomal protein L13